MNRREVKEQADAIELEFRESMEQRARKGYVLPGQMNILYSGEQVAATLEKNAVVTLATMETKYGYFRTEKTCGYCSPQHCPL